jgi:hypothetical protein
MFFASWVASTGPVRSSVTFTGLRWGPPSQGQNFLLIAIMHYAELWGFQGPFIFMTSQEGQSWGFVGTEHKNTKVHFAWDSPVLCVERAIPKTFLRTFFSIKKTMQSYVWVVTSVIPAVGRLRQEDFKFEKVYLVRPSQTHRHTQR